jgi:energy-coupling factor transporter ATP-binding protein EcfA2
MTRQIMFNATKPRSIVFVGITGGGKSTALNVLFNLKYNAAAGPSVTSECRSDLVTVNGKQYNVVDTPGFFDTRPNHQRDMPEYLEFLYSDLSKKVDNIWCIVLVKVGDMRLSPEAIAPFRAIARMFGPTSWNNLVVLNTSAFATALEQRIGWNESNETMLPEYRKHIWIESKADSKSPLSIQRSETESSYPEEQQATVENARKLLLDFVDSLKYPVDKAGVDLQLAGSMFFMDAALRECLQNCQNWTRREKNDAIAYIRNVLKDGFYSKPDENCQMLSFWSVLPEKYTSNMFIFNTYKPWLNRIKSECSNWSSWFASLFS